MMILRKRVHPRAPFLAALVVLAGVSAAQAQSSESPTSAKAPEVTQTIFLTHATGRNDLNDIQTDLRNVLPHVKIYGVASQSAITVRGAADEVEQAQKLITELDRPRKTYRLVYTLTEKDGSKTVATQRVSLVAVPGAKTVLKQGSRVPIVTGSDNADTKAPETQVQYIDIGLNIEARLEGLADDLHLDTKVEQSAVSDEKPAPGIQDPVIRQTTLESNTVLTPGKPVQLGSLDLPGASRRQEVEVVAELVH